MGNKERRKEIRKMKMKERIDSDHQLMTVWVKRGESRGKRRREIRKKRGGKKV